MITITLNAIREQSPCEEGWVKLLNHLGKTKADDEPISLETILDHMGILGTTWFLCVVNGHDLQIKTLICNWARMALPIWEKEYPDDRRPHAAIEATEQWARGEIDHATWVMTHTAMRSHADKLRLSLASTQQALWEVAVAATWGGDWDESHDVACDVVSAVASAKAQDALKGATPQEGDRWQAGWDESLATQTEEFRRFCRLEGVYAE